ncbi:IS4 family transposase [Magnetococcales bacterium HHB-1]
MSILSSDYLLKILQEEMPGYRDRIYSPLVTLSTAISQVLSEDHSCKEAVARILADRIDKGLSRCSPLTGGYCQARNRLSENMIFLLLRETGEGLHKNIPAAWQWKGRNVVLADGSTISMPDTPANQAVWPQHGKQKPGVGFPIARLVILTSLVTGSVLDVAIGPYQGKETGEHALLRQIISSLSPGDVLVADRYYCSYFLIAILINMGINAVFQNHTCRKIDFRRGQRLGKRDHIVQWEKPSRPAWMDEKTYAMLPNSIRVRETKAGGKILVSTFLDADAVTKQELADLYEKRWHVEINLKFIKQIMQMDILRL